ncbi:MAG: hypothetical protein AAF357_00310 [Verrucomicrobiota bacterium]
MAMVAPDLHELAAFEARVDAHKADERPRPAVRAVKGAFLLLDRIVVGVRVFLSPSRMRGEAS